MAGSCIRLMVVVLCFSCLVCMNRAIPVTRSSNLVERPRSSEAAETVLLDVENAKRRMEVEVNDYPGSGANNRHTPRPQGRGCVDC